jgi:hypothetical protein
MLPTIAAIRENLETDSVVKEKVTVTMMMFVLLD